MLRKKKLVGILALLLLLASFFLYLSMKKPVPTSIKVSEMKSGELTKGFPDFPIFEGAKVVNSFKGTEGGKSVYGATWQIEGKNLGEVVDWYEDNENGLPGTWIFLEPLHKDSETEPKTEWMKVAKDGWEVLVTIQQDETDNPVTVNIQASKI